MIWDPEDLWADELMERRRHTFGGANNLVLCRFEQDSGKVRQVEEAKNYVRCWEQLRRKGLGLLFWGPPGTGKTFAAACIANAIIEQRGQYPGDVRMQNFGTILTGLLARSPEDKEKYLNELIHCHLLILDDFGMERQTDYAREQMYAIIDGRYQNGLPMILTTNLSLKQLKEAADVNQQRIFDRVLEVCVPVFFEGASLRRDKAKENMRLYRQLTRGEGQQYSQN